MGNGFNLRQDILNVLRAKGVGIPGDGTVLSRHGRLYHRLNVPAAGSAQFTFFNEAKKLSITNLDQANQLPANQVMIVTGIRFSFLPGLDRDGKRLGTAITAGVAGASSLSTGVAGAAATAMTDNLAAIWKWHEKIREFLSQGLVELKVADRVMLSVYGLDAFPAGRGVVTSSTMNANSVQVAAAGTLASVQQAITSSANGAPMFGNRFSLASAIPLVAGQQFSLEVNFANAVDFTEVNLGPLNGIAGAITAGVLMAELEGELLTTVS